MGMLPLVGVAAAVPNAEASFDADGNLTDDRAKTMIAGQLKAFAAWIERLKR
jgi:hypothetical protein